MIVKTFRQTIRTDEKNIAAFTGDRADLRIHELIATAKRFLQHIATWMRARFAFADLAGTEEPADMRVVLRQLANGF